MRKTLHQQLESLLKQPYNSDFELLTQLKQLFNQNEEVISAAQPTQPITSFLDTHLAPYLSNPQNIPGAGSGFKELDKLTGGFSFGEFVVIGGRPAMGKTQFLVTLALNISREQPVLYCSYDLTDSALALRFAACHTGIESQKIREQQFGDTERAKIMAAIGELQQNHLHCYGGLNHDIDAFLLMCENHIATYGTKVIVVDYLQLLRSNRSRNYREAEVSYICSSLKALAREKQVCVIVASQLSRSVETRGGDKIPQLSDLRESGAIEQDADKVLFMYRPDYYGLEMDYDSEEMGNTIIYVAKNRSGTTGSIYLLHDRNFTRFHAVESKDTNLTIALDRLRELGFDQIPGEEPPF
jgi:replicative DNA helicase